MDDKERIRLISRIVRYAASLLALDFTATNGSRRRGLRRALVETAMILAVEAGDDVEVLLAAVTEEWEGTVGSSLLPTRRLLIADAVPQILGCAASLLSVRTARGRRMSRRSLVETAMILAVEAGGDVEALLAEIRDGASR